MAIMHSTWPHYGVQFHSKSVATCHGRQIFENFRGITKDCWLRSSSSFFGGDMLILLVSHGNHISGQVHLTNNPFVEINGDHLLQEVTRSRRPVYDLDERNCLGMSNLGTSPATIDIKLLKLTWRRTPSGVRKGEYAVDDMSREKGGNSVGRQGERRLTFADMARWRSDLDERLESGWRLGLA
ncbi:hypothetical protein NL676_018206 [Syzygium grande]|nr:hypothetical protein NL676_018206 [Syzygium grande]